MASEMLCCLPYIRFWRKDRPPPWWCWPRRKLLARRWVPFRLVWLYLFSLAESPTAFCEMMKNGFGRWPALFTSANTISQIGRMMHIYGYLIVGLGCPARRVRPCVPICLPRSPSQRTRWAGKTKKSPAIVLIMRVDYQNCKFSLGCWISRLDRRISHHLL